MGFCIGDNVKIKEDLKTGKTYLNKNGNGDIFNSFMRAFRGKEATIIDITRNGYILDIDTFHTYTDEMLELSYDELANSEYVYNPEVEALLEHVMKNHYKGLIDDALDSKLFNTEPEAFKNLVDEYNSFKPQEQ